MATQQYAKLGQQTTLTSFLLGTLIFVLYFLNASSEILLVGYGFVLAAVFFNIGILGIIVFKALKNKPQRPLLLYTGGLMLLNIPVALFYFYLTSMLLNTMRITFCNTTPNLLTDIDIIGCETRRIDTLRIGECKTKWIAINGDCTINIAYSAAQQRKEEIVSGYVTSGMGQKITYDIGSPPKIQL